MYRKKFENEDIRIKILRYQIRYKFWILTSFSNTLMTQQNHFDNPGFFGGEAKIPGNRRADSFFQRCRWWTESLHDLTATAFLVGCFIDYEPSLYPPIFNKRVLSCTHPSNYPFPLLTRNISFFSSHLFINSIFAYFIIILYLCIIQILFLYSFFFTIF